jgi:hypothetical protein
MTVTHAMRAPVRLPTQRGRAADREQAARTRGWRAYSRAWRGTGRVRHSRPFNPHRAGRCARLASNIDDLPVRDRACPRVPERGRVMAFGLISVGTQARSAADGNRARLAGCCSRSEHAAPRLSVPEP